MARKVLIACVGNIFLGDDAFGVEVARRLATRQLPEGVTVTDFGIRSYDLAYELMKEWDLVILVDALPRGGQPGTVYVMKPELSADAGNASIDAHSMDPVAVLNMVRALGGEVNTMLVVGCEPASVDEQQDLMGLSEPVRAAVDEAIQAIEELVSGTPAARAGTR